jgi:hypothetical protein
MLLLVTWVSMACACASVEWSFSRQGPAIPELCTIRTLGIAVFDPVLKSNDHLLIKVGGAFYNPIDLDGVTTKVALLVLAPDAASKFAADRGSLSRACLDVWEHEIGTVHRFDYALSDGAKPARVLGETVEGEPLPTGYDAVVAVPEPLSRPRASSAEVRDICRRYQVDVLLCVEPSVYAEVGQVSSQQSAHELGRDIDTGNFILRAQVSYEYVLFDGKSGEAITDSSRHKPQYDTRLPPETWIVDLGPSNPRAIMGFLKGPLFLEKIVHAMQEASKPYLSLFRTCTVAVPEK